MDIRLQTALKYRLQKEVFNIETLKQKLESFDFKRTLQRGFTLTYVDGVLSSSNKNIKSQTVLKTVFVDGSVESVVE
jgi:exonuclease VII large subunit